MIIRQAASLAGARKKLKSNHEREIPSQSPVTDHQFGGRSPAAPFCPSNLSWNRDSFWNYNGDPKQCVAGYFYFTGEPTFNSAPTFYPNATLFWDQRPIFAIKLTDRAYFPLMWTDINRKYQGSWGRPGDPDPLSRGVNHYELSGGNPAGSNEGYTDGHVEWIKGARYSKTPKMNYNSLEIFFYAGRP